MIGPSPIITAIPNDDPIRPVIEQAMQHGCKVYRLTCAGHDDTYVAARRPQNAWPKAQRTGWAKGGGPVTTETVWMNSAAPANVQG